MTLTPAGNPHQLIGDAQVSSGLTFTSQAGVVIKPTGYFKITVNGIVLLDGTEFSSPQADPVPGDWYGIEIETWDPLGHIEDCTIRHATWGLHIKEGS